MQTYAKAKPQAAKFQEANDCGVKAISIVCRVSYKTAHAALKVAGRVDGDGTSHVEMMIAIRTLGFEVTKTTEQPRQKNGSRYTMTTVGKGFPHGSSLVFVNRHVAAIKRGVVQDWTDGRRHQVKRVMRVQKNSA